MPIDINRLRVERGGDPQLVIESERSRFRDLKIVKELTEVDLKWREAIYTLEQMKKDFNAASKEIGKRKKVDPKDNCADLVKKSTELKTDIPKFELLVSDLNKERETKLHLIGNIVDLEVPISNTEDENLVLRTWGSVKELKIDGTPGHMHHHEIMAKLDMFEMKKGVEAAGHRGYYLRGCGVLLNLALINYGLSFLYSKGYEPVQPPYFMKKEVMAETAELKDFEETLYRIPMDKKDLCSNDKEHDKTVNYSSGKDDLFLIATSEQPLAALNRDVTIEEKDLPKKYAGFSTCFRKEAGSHGRDTWGIFRIHQFEKIEQFCITKPEDSNKMHEEMIAMSEEFYQSLELPYRVVSIVSGALNDAAAKKYDLEAWFPGYNAYRELVSCSNCTDYQARSLNTYYGFKKQGQKEREHCHMLNSTLCATQRCLCCIVENYQTPLGIEVPKVLQPYMNGITFLPFRNTEE